MTFRVPPVQPPKFIGLDEALRRVLIRVLKDEGDVAFKRAALDQTAVFLTIPQPISATDFPFSAFEVDPRQIAAAILQAIADRTMSIAEVPEKSLEPWLKRPFVDWCNGLVYSVAEISAPRFRPLVRTAEVNALFDDEEPVTGKASTPVSDAALAKFVRENASISVTQPKLREIAKGHFAPKTFTEKKWRDALKSWPPDQKRRPGDNAATLKSKPLVK